MPASPKWHTAGTSRKMRPILNKYGIAIRLVIYLYGKLIIAIFRPKVASFAGWQLHNAMGRIWDVPTRGGRTSLLASRRRLIRLARLTLGKTLSARGSLDTSWLSHRLKRPSGPFFDVPADRSSRCWLGAQACLARRPLQHRILRSLYRPKVPRHRGQAAGSRPVADAFGRLGR